MALHSAASCSDKVLAPEPFSQVIAGLAQTGFSHIHFDQLRRLPDLPDDRQITAWRKDLDHHGLAVLDVHGCRQGGLHHVDPDLRTSAITDWQRQLEITHRLGGTALTCHVPTTELDDGLTTRFLDALATLEPCARDLGICLALENHYRADVDHAILSAAYQRFDPDFIGLTLDTGHGMLSGTSDWLLSTCCQRLAALHLNDNDGQRDHHWIPFAADGIVPWDRVAAVIAASPYRGPIQLEIWRNPACHPDRNGFLADAYAATCRLTEMVEGLRSA